MLSRNQLPRVGQAFEELPAQITAAQARAWLGLTLDQWVRVRKKRQIKAAEVWGATGNRRLLFWTVKLAPLVPPGADTVAAAMRRQQAETPPPIEGTTPHTFAEADALMTAGAGR
jgi:hypothetical protein